MLCPASEFIVKLTSSLFYWRTLLLLRIYLQQKNIEWLSCLGSEQGWVRATPHPRRAAPRCVAALRPRGQTMPWATLSLKATGRVSFGNHSDASWSGSRNTKLLNKRQLTYFNTWPFCGIFCPLARYEFPKTTRATRPKMLPQKTLRWPDQFVTHR